MSSRDWESKTLREPRNNVNNSSFAKLAIALASLLCVAAVARGQEPAPHAYVITPLHSNAITLTYSYFTRTVQFDGTLPGTGAGGKINMPIVTYDHLLGFFGRFSNETPTTNH
ncbi:MAG: hypothetical protein WBQ89_02330 [Candidatus Acidiferrum sp.]